MKHRDCSTWEMQEILLAIERAYLMNGIDKELLGFAARTLMAELIMERAEAASEISASMLDGADVEWPKVIGWGNALLHYAFGRKNLPQIVGGAAEG
jgi:hypothetical protein